MARASSDFRHALDLRVNLRRADAHAAGIERGVGAAVDDDAAMRGPFGEVAMRPDAGKPLEIGAPVLRAIRIVPEHDRHGREGHGADELALLAPDRAARLVEHIDRHAEARPLDLAAPDGLRRYAEHEAGDDVGAAGNRGEVDIRLDRLVDEIEILRRQRRTRRGHHSQSRQIVAVARAKTRLAHCIDELRRRAEDRHPLVLRIIEERAPFWMEGRAVVEEKRRARCEAGGEPVPHHPAAGGEVEEPVFGRERAMQPVLFQMLEQRAAGAMHDAFRSARRAGGEEDIERMVEGQPLEA